MTSVTGLPNFCAFGPMEKDLFTRNESALTRAKAAVTLDTLACDVRHNSYIVMDSYKYATVERWHEYDSKGTQNAI